MTTLNLGLQCYIFAQNYTTHLLNIKTIIFDLGGVIIDLDESATYHALANLGAKTYDEVVQIAYNEPIFREYEMGLVDDVTLRNGMRSIFGKKLKNQQIDDAWNAMLGAIPKTRLNLLVKLRTKFHVAILSNTNHIHELAFNQILKKSSNQPSLHSFVDQVFFSHEMNMRKPDLEIYQKVLELTETKPTEALFLDDKLENLRGAQAAGLQTMHINSPDEIFKLNKYVE